MATGGLEIVRFRKRYYIRYHQMDSYYEGLGADIVGSIPADPKKYQAWLERNRAYFAEELSSLEAFETCEHVEQTPYCDFTAFPGELPRLDEYGAEYFYTIDLDREVLTMNHGIHWKLTAIPRENQAWLQAIRDSIYPGKPTVSLDIVAEENMASLALELPSRNADVSYASQLVAPRTDIVRAGSVFLTHVAAGVLVEYKDEIIRFAREWSPSSFPFRELTFALVSIASGQATFHSLPDHDCSKDVCNWQWSRLTCIRASLASLSDEWAAKKSSLFEFGSMVHAPDHPPGVSPLETTYWLGDVLVTLALVPDGEAVSKAVTWGTEQGRVNFQIVVLSLFEAVFAEVTLTGGAPFVKVSNAIKLSPLRAEYCLSTHPRDRPELKPGMKIQHHIGEKIMESNCTSTAERLRGQFPGLAALVEFFDVAASRGATSKTAGRLPTELYDQILGHVDLETWKTCLKVSTEFRSCCLRKFRLDHRTTIVREPFVVSSRDRLMSFNFEDVQTGEITPMVQYRRPCWRPYRRPYLRSRNKAPKWHPLVGNNRKALMCDVAAYFKPIDMPVYTESDDEAS